MSWPKENRRRSSADSSVGTKYLGEAESYRDKKFKQFNLDPVKSRAQNNKSHAKTSEPEQFEKETPSDKALEKLHHLASSILDMVNACKGKKPQDTTFHVRLDVEKPALLDEELKLDSSKQNKRRVSFELGDKAVQNKVSSSSSTSIGHMKKVVNKSLPPRRVSELSKVKDPRLDSSIKRQKHGFPAAKITLCKMPSPEKRTAPTSCENCHNQRHFETDPRFNHKRYQQILRSRCLVCFYPMTDDGSRVTLRDKAPCNKDNEIGQCISDNNARMSDVTNISHDKVGINNSSNLCTKHDNPTSDVCNVVVETSRSNATLSKSKSDVNCIKDFPEPIQPVSSIGTDQGLTRCTSTPTLSAEASNVTCVVQSKCSVESEAKAHNADSNRANVNSSQPTSRQLELLRELLRKPLDSNFFAKSQTSINFQMSSKSKTLPSSSGVGNISTTTDTSPLTSKEQVSPVNSSSSFVTSSVQNQENSKYSINSTVSTSCSTLKEPFLKSHKINTVQDSTFAFTNMDNFIKKEATESGPVDESCVVQVVSTSCIKIERPVVCETNASVVSTVPKKQNVGSFEKSSAVTKSSIQSDEPTSVSDPSKLESIMTSPLSISFNVLSSTQPPVGKTPVVTPIVTCQALVDNSSLMKTNASQQENEPTMCTDVTPATTIEALNNVDCYDESKVTIDISYPNPGSSDACDDDIISKGPGLVVSDDEKLSNSGVFDTAHETAIIDLPSISTSADNNSVMSSEVISPSKMSIASTDLCCPIGDSDSKSSPELVKKDGKNGTERSIIDFMKDSNTLLNGSKSTVENASKDPQPKSVKDLPTFDDAESADLTMLEDEVSRESFDWFEDNLPTLNVKSKKRKRRHLAAFSPKALNVDKDSSESSFYHDNSNSNSVIETNRSENVTISPKRLKTECMNENVEGGSLSTTSVAMEDDHPHDTKSVSSFQPIPVYQDDFRGKITTDISNPSPALSVNLKNTDLSNPSSALSVNLKNTDLSNPSPGLLANLKDTDLSNFDLDSPMSPVVISDSDDEVYMVTSAADVATATSVNDSVNEIEIVDISCHEMSGNDASSCDTEDSSQWFAYKDKLYCWPFSSPSLEEIQAMSDDDSEPEQESNLKDISIFPILLEESGFVPKCFLHDLPNHVCCTCCPMFCCSTSWIPLTKSSTSCSAERL